MLAQNTERRKEETKLNEENKFLSSVAEQFNKISKKRSANTRANITKNTANLNDKLGEEHIIDQEIAELKHEISNLDNRIHDTKKSFMEDKTYLKENVPHVQEHKHLKDEMFKMDVEIEKYKRAYDDLLNQWESGIKSNGPMPNAREMDRNRSFYSDLYRTKFSKGYGTANRSILDTTRDLNKSYTDKYKDKTDYRGYYEPYVS
jgi:chromosome segregation ATPase